MLISLLLACNGVDKDSSVDGTDADQDGYIAEAGGGDDCDDDNDGIHPGATEICDDADVDENCDGSADGDDASGGSDWYPDFDGDGFGEDVGAAISACDAPAGYAGVNTDCDDTAAAVNPGATEVCDGLDVDEDCDGLVDDADPSVDLAGTGNDVYADTDGDGYGAGVGGRACDPAEGESLYDTDCADSDPARNPGATEVCDEALVDEDCDGLSDDDDDSTDISGMQNFFADVDQDGWGDEPTGAKCRPGARDSVADGDCDDRDEDVNPGATEVCDGGVDNDCNGLADEEDSNLDFTTLSTWYLDSDNDNYGATDATGSQACDDPSSGRTYYASNNTDCDDANRNVNPGAREVCDSSDLDEDCNGLADDADPNSNPSTWYEDADDDDYGSESASAAATSCEDPSDGTSYYASNNRDCDDTNADISPGDAEECDDLGIDEDCDGRIDDDDPSCATTDTGIALMWYAGDAEVDASGNFVTGHFGTDITDIAELPDFTDSLCWNVGEWTEDNGSVPAGCNGCDWEFSLVVNDTVAEGDYCSDMGRSGGEWDGFAGAWGFAESYAYTYSSYTYQFDLTLLYYFSGGYWGVLAYNYGGYGYNTGDQYSMSFHRYYAAYYFYR